MKYLAGYGTKYLVREDRTVWRLDVNGEYVSVAEHAGRVRLYHLGTESRRSVDVIMDSVFPDLTDEEIISYDESRGVPPGGGSLALSPIHVDTPNEMLESLLSEVEGEEPDMSEDSGETLEGNSLFDL